MERREYKWAEHREDLFSPGATHSASRVIDFLALKMGLETFEADAVDAYYQAPEHEEVVVEPAQEYLERLSKAGRYRDIMWRLRRQLPVRRAAGQSWVEHVTGILVNKLGFMRCTTAPQFHWSLERMVALELPFMAQRLRVDAKSSSKIWHWKSISRELTDVRYEHLKRLRLPMTGDTRTRNIWDALRTNWC